MYYDPELRLACPFSLFTLPVKKTPSRRNVKEKTFRNLKASQIIL